jgi:hypothetical protein
MSRLTNGALAGAAGTALLNAVTYLDVVARGRPPSSIPEDNVQRLAERAGVSLGSGETRDARTSGLGALLGYVNGFGMGAAYGIAAPLFAWLPRPLSALLVGAGAMLATNAGSVSLGTTDPRSWSAGDWLADIVPHVVYGAGVVGTYDALSR